MSVSLTPNYISFKSIRFHLHTHEYFVVSFSNAYADCLLPNRSLSVVHFLHFRMKNYQRVSIVVCSTFDHMLVFLHFSFIFSDFLTFQIVAISPWLLHGRIDPKIICSWIYISQLPTHFSRSLLIQTFFWSMKIENAKCITSTHCAL